MDDVRTFRYDKLAEVNTDGLNSDDRKVCTHALKAHRGPEDEGCMHNVSSFDSAISDNPIRERVYSASKLLYSSDDDMLMETRSYHSLQNARNSVTGEPIFYKSIIKTSCNDDLPLCQQHTRSSPGQAFSRASPCSSTLSPVDFEWIPSASIDGVALDHPTLRRGVRLGASDTPQDSLDENDSDSDRHSLVASCSYFLQEYDQHDPSSVPAAANVLSLSINSTSSIDSLLRRPSPGSAPILPASATIAVGASTRMLSQRKPTRPDTREHRIADEVCRAPGEADVLVQELVGEHTEQPTSKEKPQRGKGAALHHTPDTASTSGSSENGTDEEPSSLVNASNAHTSVFPATTQDMCTSVAQKPTPWRSKKYRHQTADVHDLKVPRLQSHEVNPPTVVVRQLSSPSLPKSPPMAVVEYGGVARASARHDATSGGGGGGDGDGENAIHGAMKRLNIENGSYGTADCAQGMGTLPHRRAAKTPEPRVQDEQDRQSDGKHSASTGTTTHHNSDNSNKTIATNANHNQHISALRTKEVGRLSMSRIASGSRTNFFVQRAQQLNSAALAREASQSQSAQAPSPNWPYIEEDIRYDAMGNSSSSSNNKNHVNNKKPLGSVPSPPHPPRTVGRLSAMDVAAKGQGGGGTVGDAGARVDTTSPMPVLRRLSLCALSPQGSATGMTDGVGAGEPVRVNSDLFVKDYTRPHTSAARLSSNNTYMGNRVPSSRNNTHPENSVSATRQHTHHHRNNHNHNHNSRHHSSNQNSSSVPNLGCSSTRDGGGASTPIKSLGRNAYEIMPDVSLAPEVTTGTPSAMPRRRLNSAHRSGSGSSIARVDIAVDPVDGGAAGKDNPLREMDQQGRVTTSPRETNAAGEAHHSWTTSGEHPLNVLGLRQNCNNAFNFSLKSELIHPHTRDALLVNTSLSTTSSWPSNHRMDQNELSQTRGSATTNPHLAWKLLSFSEQKSVAVLQTEPVNGNPQKTKNKTGKHKDKTEKGEKRRDRFKKSSSKDPNKHKRSADGKQNGKKRETDEEVAEDGCHAPTEPPTPLPLPSPIEQQQQQSSPQHHQHSPTPYPRAATPISPSHGFGDVANSTSNKNTSYDVQLANGMGLQRHPRQYTTLHRPVVELLLHAAKRSDGGGDGTGDVARSPHPLPGNYKMPAVPKNELVHRPSKGNSFGSSEDVPRRRWSGSGGGNNSSSNGHSGGLDGGSGRRGSGAFTARDTFNAVNTDQYDKQHVGLSKLAAQRNGLNSARVTSNTGTTVRRTTIRTTLFRLANQGLNMTGLTKQ